MRWREAALLALLSVAACGSGSERAATPATRSCRPVPIRTAEGAPQVQNLVEPSPDGSVDTDGDGRADVVEPGLTIRAATKTLRFPGAELRTSGDLDGDGHDDLVLRVGDHDVAVPGTVPGGIHDPDEAGVRLGPRLVYLWPDDLDGRPGVDFVEPHRDGARSRTVVWSGAGALARGDVPPARTIVGLPRVRAVLAAGARAETILLVPGRRTSLRFAARPGVELRTPWSASRVEDVLLFREAGARRIALVVDRHVAVWAAPPRCQ